MSLGINLADYQNGSQDNTGAFGVANTTPEALAELSKALEAGSITGRETTNLSNVGAQGLKVESLEKNLKLLSFRDQDIRLWRRIPKLAAFNTVEEFNQLVSYGTERGGFNLEGELPEEEDSTYVRRAELVKFLGVTKSITHPMQLVTTNIGSIVQREITNGTMWILRKVNKALAYGNAAVIPQEFNGLYAQHANNDTFASLEAYFTSSSVIDLRGAALTQVNVADGTLSILQNFGFGNLLFAPPSVINDLAKDYFDKQRILLGTAGNAFVGGGVPKSISTTTGEVELQHDIFLQAAAPRLTTDGATSTKAPASPIPDISAPLAAVTDTGTKFTDIAGDYFYGVAAINRFGESAVVQLGTGKLTLAATQSATLKFATGGGANPATGYVIYRSKKNPATLIGATPMYAVFSVSTANLASGYDGGSALTIRDRGRFIAGTEQAILIQGDEEVFSFKQLAPLMKMDLAILGPSIRFMILLYGTPQLYAPRKMVRYINIGAFA